MKVALFARAWIEIIYQLDMEKQQKVALFTRVWIEISVDVLNAIRNSVALFTRAWIEIGALKPKLTAYFSRPLYEGVD